MSQKKDRVTAILGEELYERFEDFRYGRRFNSQSAAASALIEMGLERYEAEVRAQLSDAEKKEATDE